MKGRLAVLAAVAAFAAGPAAAEVVQATPAGFDVKQVVTVDAPIAQTWDVLLAPRKWGDHDHTYSDDSANLSLDPRAGGCLCEAIPASKGAVEHARVVYIQGPRMLRMAGSGTLTFRLDPEGMGTRVTLEYVGRRLYPCRGGHACAEGRQGAGDAADRIKGGGGGASGHETGKRTDALTQARSLDSQRIES